jgi:hypothetical protein
MTDIAIRLALRATAERAALQHPAAKAVRLTGPQAHGLFVLANGSIDFKTMMGSNVHRASMWRVLAIKGLAEVHERPGDPAYGVPARIYKVEITEAGLALAVELWG